MIGSHQPRRHRLCIYTEGLLRHWTTLQPLLHRRPSTRHHHWVIAKHCDGEPIFIQGGRRFAPFTPLFLSFYLLLLH